MSTARSKDGTLIAYERLGWGPPLILVDGALCSRRFGPMPKLAPLLGERTLSGQTHNVKPQVLTPVVTEFFAMG